MPSPDSCPFDRFRAGVLIAFLALAVPLAAAEPAAATPEAGGQAAVEGDPLEGFNRQVLKGNNFFDRILLKPLAQAYDFVLPDRLQTGIGNILRNLNSPLIFANNLLQGDFKGAGKTLGRFIINSTVGVGGAYDFANNQIGWRHEPEDFGQTLAVWGVDSGPYLVLPFFGPSNLRDAFGLGVETFADPFDLYLENNEEFAWRMARLGVTALDGRAGALGQLEQLREGSLDFYATLRSAYTQRRESLIRDGAAEEIEFPDFDSFDDAAMTLEGGQLGEVDAIRALVEDPVLLRD